jgi:hypothetical protein
MRDLFPCDYGQCVRGASEPFTRKDHYRDHLRDFHKEPIGCAKGEKTAKDRNKWPVAQKTWLDERRYNSKWWRCAKCLVRVNISESGYECRACKLVLEDDYRKRIEASRQKLAGTGQIGTSDDINILHDTERW